MNNTALTSSESETAPNKVSFFDLNRDELRQWFKDHGHQAFRADQLLQWVYEKYTVDLQAMTNLSKALREDLTQHFSFHAADVLKHQIASDGTQKLLLAWPEESLDFKRKELLNASPGELKILNENRARFSTECVMIPSDNQSGGQRKTACVSSMIGCPVQCKFCASGLGGLDANLSAGRIVEQIWHMNQLPQVGRISNVVFMGMGEPLSNFNAVIRAIEILSSDWGFGISQRKITVSTVGLPAQIRRLADQNSPVTLAISLHAPNDEIRKQIIPWADFVTMEQILDAGRYYFQKTRREITLEYIMLGGLNDQPQHAKELCKVAQTLRANVNLIRYNEVKGLPYKRPSSSDVHHFQQILRNAGINTHIRASRGRDIAAACGQLRYEAAAKS